MDPCWTLDNPIPPPSLRGREVLFWYEGPRIQVIEVDGVPHVGTWADCNEDFTVDRWMLARAPEGVIESLTASILPIRDVFTREPSVIVVDIHKDGNLQAAWCLAAEKIPEKVLAERGAKLRRLT